MHHSAAAHIFKYVGDMDVYEHFIARSSRNQTDMDPPTQLGIPEWLQWAPTFFWVSDQRTLVGHAQQISPNRWFS